MMKRSRSNLLLRILASFVLLSLFWSLVTILETLHGINSEHVLCDSEVNRNHFSALPTLASTNSLNNAKEIFEERTLQSKDLHRDQGRALKSLSEWRIWKDDPPEYNMSDAKGTAFSQYLGCKEIKAIQAFGNIGRGYTKTVQKGLYKGIEVALKSAQIDSEDIKQCLKNPMVNLSVEECFIFAKYKVAKEIIMLQQLQHANIVKLLGFCWQNELNNADLETRGLTMVTEIGKKIDVISLVQLPWHERFRICLGLARLLHYLANSPLGSLQIRDFKLSQFVLVRGEIKLTDFDDVDNEEPRCSTKRECVVKGFNRNKTLPCDQGTCRGLIAARNLQSVALNFINHILVPGAPEHLQACLKEIKFNLQRLTWDSETLLWHSEKVLALLRSGKHLETVSELNFYKKVPGSDFPNLHDYHCSESRLFGACELAVYDVTEAKHKCDLDDSCKAFVTTGKILWSGYFIVYLKNDTSNMQPNRDTTVFIKHSS